MYFFNECASCVLVSEYRNDQKPGIICGMTVEEYNNASKPDPGKSVVMIQEHKGDKPARVVASGRIVQELEMWVTLLRSLLVAGESPYVFCIEEGKKLTHLSRCITDLSKKFNIQYTHSHRCTENHCNSGW